MKAIEQYLHVVLLLLMILHPSSAPGSKRMFLFTMRQTYFPRFVSLQRHAFFPIDKSLWLKTVWFFLYFLCPDFVRYFVMRSFFAQSITNIKPIHFLQYKLIIFTRQTPYTVQGFLASNDHWFPKLNVMKGERWELRRERGGGGGSSKSPDTFPIRFQRVSNMRRNLAIDRRQTKLQLIPFYIKKH